MIKPKKGDRVRLKFLKDCHWIHDRKAGDIVDATLITQGRTPSYNYVFNQISDCADQLQTRIARPDGMFQNIEFIPITGTDSTATFIDPITTPKYRYLDSELREGDMIDFGDLNYIVRDTYLFNASGTNDQILYEFSCMKGIKSKIAFVEYAYGYKSGGGDWPSFRNCDWPAISRCVDALIYYIITNMPTDEVPIIKVRGKVIKTDTVDQPAQPQGDMTDDQIMDIMEAALKAIEEGKALTPEQQKAMEGLQSPPPPPGQGQGNPPPQQQPPRPFLVVYVNQAGQTANWTSSPANAVQEAIAEFNASADTVILNVIG